jgi:SAM-dependent methyltransferase
VAPFYGEDLAHIHDTGFDAIGRAAATTLVGHLHAAGHRDGLVADLGCGSGNGSEVLAAAGFDVLGIDRAAHLLAIARRRLPAARWVEASIDDAVLPPCVGVLTAGEVVNYAAGALADLAIGVANALAPGGTWVLDVAGPGREPGGGRRTWHEGRDWLLCLEAEEDARAATLRRRITTFRATDGTWRRGDEQHVLRLLDPDTVAHALRGAGLDPRPLPRGYAGLPLPPGLTAFAAARR